MTLNDRNGIYCTDDYYAYCSTAHWSD